MEHIGHTGVKACIRLSQGLREIQFSKDSGVGYGDGPRKIVLP
jgi:hypothetical protein